MKSRAMLLRSVYEGILADCVSYYPQKAQTFARDLSRLQMVIDRNEIWFFTLFLPTFSKHLTRCVDEGLFLPLPGPHMRTRKGCVYPRLFSGLTEQLFDNSGALIEAADGTPLRLLQQLLTVAKKLRIECDADTVRKTVASFVEVEEDVRHFSLNWGDIVLSRDRGIGITGDGIPSCGLKERGLFDKLDACPPNLLPYFGAIQSVSDRITSSFGTPFTGDLEPRHGPGAIADRGSNPSKYQFSNWPAKLEDCFPSLVFGLPNAGFRLQPTGDVPERLRFSTDSVASRLLAVPKTQKGPRLIAAEPVANMWMQQALLKYLEKSVSKTPLRNCISFRDQSKSGQLALQASLTKSHGTIDLSDASDRLSCWLVERLFRSNYDLLSSFNAVRTDLLSISPEMGREFPKLIKLKKFSTQGSALTFPVQTIVYALIAIGVLIEHSGKQVTSKTINWASKEVRLYGDDIIVPTRFVDKVIECLTALGFKVNTTKTFSKGNFRESCGVDGFKGMDVTPAYVLEPYDSSKPSTVSSLVECANNFYQKGFYHAANAIKSTLPKSVLMHIPTVSYGSGAFGFISFEGAQVSPHRSRWNEKLSRREIRILSQRDVVEKSRIPGEFALLQWFTEEPVPTERWISGEARRPKSTMRLRWVPVETLV